MNAIPSTLAKTPFAFQVEKCAHAVATLLRQEPHFQMDVHRLYKLLYLADRTSLQEAGRPVIGGRLLATHRGPMHSAVMDLIQGTSTESPWWSNHFRTQHYWVEMINDPGIQSLSKREINLLARLQQEHISRDDVELNQFLQSFKEIASRLPVGSTPREISFDDLLAGVGRLGDKAEIEKEAHAKSVFDDVFGV